MLEKELKSHYFVTLVWLATIVILRLLVNLKVFFSAINFLSWLMFCLGTLLGTFILDADQLVSALFFYPESVAAKQVRQLFKQNKFKEIAFLLADTYQGRTKRPFHSAIFQVFFAVFSFWVITSTGYWLGKGMVMATGLHLLKDEIELLLKNRPELLRPWLFWQIKKEVSFQQQKVFVVIMLLLFLGLNLLLI
jgi:hypothetical protein